MDFYELRNKYFSQVQRKMINDYKMGNIDFMESEELIDTIIEGIGVYQDTDKSENDSICFPRLILKDQIGDVMESKIGVLSRGMD